MDEAVEYHPKGSSGSPMLGSVNGRKHWSIPYHWQRDAKDFIGIFALAFVICLAHFSYYTTQHTLAAPYT